MTDPDPYAAYLAAALAEDEDYQYRLYYPEPATTKENHR